MTDAQLARLHGPVGLPIGSHTPPEIAVAILGFSTIRSMAILVASGLRNLKHPAPAGFTTSVLSDFGGASCVILVRLAPAQRA